MQIVGVIDLKDGRAVHAKGGRRHTYQPVAWSAGVRVDGDPLALARVYVERLHVSRLYVADLDAIASGVLQASALRHLQEVGVPLLVDAGVTTIEAAFGAAAAGADTVVIGLETLPSIGVLADICAADERPGVAFSLDLRNGVAMTPRRHSADVPPEEPEEIAARAASFGIDEMVVLDVARVGIGGGPDLALLRRIRSVTHRVPVLAGGGIRGLDDLRDLANCGCAGALVATAIHEGRLAPRDIDAAHAFSH